MIKGPVTSPKQRHILPFQQRLQTTSIPVKRPQIGSDWNVPRHNGTYASPLPLSILQLTKVQWGWSQLVLCRVRIGKERPADPHWRGRLCSSQASWFGLRSYTRRTKVLALVQALQTSKSMTPHSKDTLSIFCNLRKIWSNWIMTWENCPHLCGWKWNKSYLESYCDR